MRAVDSNSPLRVLKPANTDQDVWKLIGSDRIVRKQEPFVVNALQFCGSLYSSVTPAAIFWVREPTMRPHKANNFFASAFQSFAKSLSPYPQNGCPIAAVDFENLSQNVGDPVGPIQAKQHR